MFVGFDISIKNVWLCDSLSILGYHQPMEICDVLFDLVFAGRNGLTLLHRAVKFILRMMLLRHMAFQGSHGSKGGIALVREGALQMFFFLRLASR